MTYTITRTANPLNIIYSFRIMRRYKPLSYWVLVIYFLAFLWGHFYVAISNKKVIGFAVGFYQFIFHIAVLHRYKDKGIGSELLEYIERAIKHRGENKIMLNILPGSESFYLKHGYKTYTMIKGLKE